MKRLCAIVLSVISTILPIAAVFYCIYEYNNRKIIDNAFESQTDNSAFTVSIIILVLTVLQFIALRIPLKKMLNKAILEEEYDQFGKSKKKSFENLTRKEREMMDLQKAAQSEQLLSSSVIKKITHKGSETPERELDKLVGLNSVKQKVTEMVARMKFEQEVAKDNKDRKQGPSGNINGRHFCFYGSAGTGKTTVARIIAGFLYQNGNIKENKVIEINGGFLKAGEYSEEKTKLVIQQAYDGVLFIDEAYSMIEGNERYGRAVIAALIKEMEDNRDKFTVILAGYKSDMKRLLDANEGFKSRIKEYLEFPDYSVEEMKDIFTIMANASNFVVSKEAMDNFEIRASREKQLPSFGNGRTVRNILDEVIDKHALNYGQGVIKKEDKYLIRGCDVVTASNKKVL